MRGVLFLTAALCTAATIQVRGAAADLGYLDISSKWRSGTAALFVIPGLFWLFAVLSLTRLGGSFGRGFEAAAGFLQRLGKGNWLIFLASLGLFSILAVGWQPNLTYGYFTRLFFLWLFGLAGAASLRGVWPQAGWAYTILTVMLVFGASFKIASYVPAINNNPFTLTWSETSNYFYSSLFLAQKLYGFATPLPFFNPARALLGVVPFLAPAPQIWINRLWTSLLWVGCTGLAAWLVSRRLHLKGRLTGGLFTLWAFGFLFQGPVYYELLLAVAPVLWLFNPRHFWRSLLVVVLASAWAGLCRVNWFPMPGLLAALLYFLETPVGSISGWRYLWSPAVYAGAGTAAALATFAGYNAISGNPTSATGAALQSPLLWYRLFPSGTSGPGVLPTALLTALPALILIGLWLAKPGRRWSRWRKLGVFAILASFFAGGLVVSAKIGGGANIHNLDAFWVLLLVVTGYLYFNRSPSDDSLEPEAVRVPAWLTAALSAFPILILLTQAPANALPAQNALDDVLQQMNSYISIANQNGQEVLFIDNKQLLTFGYFPGTKMVTEYETGYMLEMAMTGNQAYFEPFWQDLKNKRFAYIFANPQPTRLQDTSESFAEENNAQITWIGRPLLCYYQVQFTWLAMGVEVFTPRPEAVNCP